MPACATRSSSGMNSRSDEIFFSWKRITQSSRTAFSSFTSVMKYGDR